MGDEINNMSVEGFPIGCRGYVWAGLAIVDVISFTHWYFTISLSNKKRYQVIVSQLFSVPQSHVKFFCRKGG